MSAHAEEIMDGVDSPMGERRGTVGRDYGGIIEIEKIQWGYVLRIGPWEIREIR